MTPKRQVRLSTFYYEYDSDTRGAKRRTKSPIVGPNVPEEPEVPEVPEGD